MKPTPRRPLVIALCGAIGAAAISLGRPVPERPAASVLDAGSRASVAPRWRTRVDTLRRGEPLVTVFYIVLGIIDHNEYILISIQIMSILKKVKLSDI